MSIKYVYGAVFMIWSLTYHNSRHSIIEKDNIHFKKDLQKPKITNFYQMVQLWWEMNNRESVVSMTDVKRNGTDIEKVWCEGA